MMAEIPTLLIVSRWFHLSAVIVAIGGTLFLRWVLHPAAAKALAAGDQDVLRGAVIARWARFVHACVAVILLTGTYNLYVMLAAHKGQPLYHSLLGTKILLALALFFIAIAITGRNPAFEKMRRKRLAWMTVNLVLAGAIVAISNVLKNIPTAG